MTETTDSLNVQIARALGWTNIHAEMQLVAASDMTSSAWNYVPNGRMAGRPPGAGVERRIPDCEHSLDAVMSANTAPNASLNVSKMPTGWLADINAYDSDKVFVGQGASAAEAAARALLAFLMAQQQQEAGE